MYICVYISAYVIIMYSEKRQIHSKLVYRFHYFTLIRYDHLYTLWYGTISHLKSVGIHVHSHSDLLSLTLFLTSTHALNRLSLQMKHLAQRIQLLLLLPLLIEAKLWDRVPDHLPLVHDVIRPLIMGQSKALCLFSLAPLLTERVIPLMTLQGHFPATFILR